MTELTDLNDTDALNTAVTGQSTEGNVANMGNMDNLFQATLGMLSRFRNSNIFRLRDNTDKTKLLAFDLSGLTTATTRTVTVPDESARMALAPHLAGHLYGLTLSNNVTDATNDIDIATGSAIDSGNVHIMTLASALTKRIDAAWAVGTGNGGLDTGTVANGSYHVWLIKRTDTGVVDVLFSLSASAPTMPTNYTLKRRIGSIIRTGGAIKGFTQYGNVFRWKDPIRDLNASSAGTSAVTRALTVPSGIVVQVLFGAELLTNSSGDGVYLSELTATDTAVGTNTISLITTAAANTQDAQFALFTDTSGQIRSRQLVGDVNQTLRIFTNGWVDART